MTQDEQKHPRHGDGKYAKKTNSAPAGSLGGVTALPVDIKEGMFVRAGDTLFWDAKKDNPALSWAYKQQPAFREAFDKAGKPSTVSVLKTHYSDGDKYLVVEIGGEQFEVGVHREALVPYVDEEYGTPHEVEGAWWDEIAGR